MENPSFKKSLDTPKSKYRQDIELLRILSALGIVWFHTRTLGMEYAYSGLIVFIILSVYFCCISDAESTLRRRTSRLLLPWVFWFLFYAALRVRIGWSIVPTDNGWIAGLLGGPNIHLWYLPFIFSVIVALDFARRHISGRTLAYLGGFLCFLGLATWAVWRTPAFDLGAPWKQYAHAACAVFAGIFLGRYHDMQPAVRRILIGMILAASVYALGSPGLGLPYLIGISVFYAVVVWAPFKGLAFDFRPISTLTFGIYLIHPFMQHCLKGVGLKDGASVFVATLAVAWGFRRILPRLAKYVM